MTSNEQSIASSLEQARKELLDLGLRNSLLNYRVSKARGVEVVPADTSQVFQWLVTEERALSFLSLPPGEPAQEGQQAAPDDSAQAAEAAEVATPRYALKTGLSEAALKSRLLATHLAARTHIEERGSNILFLALGMLHWYESEDSEKALRAPLVLVPVALKRTTARDRFTLGMTEEDVEDNLSLATKLRTDFGLRFPELPAIEDLAVDPYFDEVAACVADMKRWTVRREEVSLGFFSFGKFLMYKDLAVDEWVDPATGQAPPLLNALLRDGFAAQAPVVAEEQYLDSLIAPGAVHQVVDADSSQALAILDVRAGRHLVIQGPPGTGKSQTITNVIADAIGQGKKVLFVAEKMAALEVVKRRLDKVGVGDACLELHSHTANKKALLAELKRTLQLGRPHLAGGHFNLGQYSQLRDQLTAYSQAVNEPVGDMGFTPHQVMGELMAIGAALGDLPLPRPASGAQAAKPISRLELDRLSSVVAGLERHLAVIGKPSEHPFKESTLASLLPSQRQQVADAINEAVQASQALHDATLALAGRMGLSLRPNVAQAGLLVQALRRAMTESCLRDLALGDPQWRVCRDDIRELLSAGTELSALHAGWDGQLIPEAWSADLVHARQVLMTTGRAWWRFLSSDYRQVRRQIAGLCNVSPVGDVDGQLRIVEAILKERRLALSLERHAARGQQLFGAQWRAGKSDWTALARIGEWVIELHRAVDAQELPPGFIEFLASRPELDALGALAQAVERALLAQERAFPVLEQALALQPGLAGTWKRYSFSEQQAQLAAWRQALDRLPQWVTYNNLAGSLHQAGLGWLVDAAASWDGAGQHLTHLFRHVALEAILRLATSQREALRTFSGASHEHAREQFVQLDQASFSAAQLELATRHWQALPKPGGAGQLGLLMREFEKRSRHLPIRRLMKEAGHAVQAIKPVLMMSPMSVASFLPAGAARFDLVIFDEASQVRPVDALGAVLRGEQLVVVGDSKQLPPTSFFDTLVAADEEPNEAEEEAGVTADMESILGLVAGQGAPQRMLRWHYRSRHESLIALSNKEFYDSRLVVFPSPEAHKSGLGLKFHHLRETAYDRGRSRTNRGEAQAVAKAVIAHAHQTPHLTLGVAAFSLSQAQAIIDELEKLRAGDRLAEAFFSQHPFEPFFVKNLESVQGDERDVIFISVGYGKDADGYLSMAFGALNGNGGERRLNVLITRARLSCEVFSNLTADDIDLGRTQARGVAALKAYLHYAATGILEVPDAGRGGHESAFEGQVAQALSGAGHRVVAQVGSGGFRIDLAVVDPLRPGRYLLGIECDGATYHSARSTRDRDRLREQVLKGLGWRIHRIWSTDWFADPGRELERVLAAIDEAKTGSPLPSAPEPAEPAPLVQRSEASDPAPVPRAPQAAPYVMATVDLRLGDKGLHEVPERQLVALIAQVVGVEGPVHRSEVMRRIADAVGVKRIGSRISEHLERAATAAAQRGLVSCDGEFLAAPGQVIEPRDRSALPAASRKMELVAPQEVAFAIHQIVQASYGIARDEVHVSVARILGFSRVSADVADGIDRVLAGLIEQGRLVNTDGQIQVSAAVQ